MRLFEFRVYRQALVSTLVVLSTSFSLAVAAGGGSSTGGGHVSVCLKPKVATRVKAIIRENAQIPQLATDPFAEVKDSDIVSVKLLDIVEAGDFAEDEFDLFTKEFVAKLSMSPNFHAFYSPSWFSNLSVHLSEIGKHASAFALDSAFDRAAYALGRLQWHESDHGLAVTDDFSPKYLNPPNCVFAQVARQNNFAIRSTVMDYDEKLLRKMSATNRVALAIHEVYYRLVLNAPHRDRVTNPSIYVRQLTALTLAYMSAYPALIGDAANDIAALLEQLGYGPFPDMHLVRILR
jgi:hypothetical protein